MEYLEALKSINTLYYVGAKPLDLTRFDPSLKETHNVGDGIYLYPNKWWAIAELKFRQLPHNSNDINVYTYKFDTSRIDFSQLTNNAWGYMVDDAFISPAQEITGDMWYNEVIRHSNIQHVSLLCCQISDIHWRFAPNNTSLSYGGFLFKTEYLHFSFCNQQSLSLLELKETQIVGERHKVFSKLHNIWNQKSINVKNAFARVSKKINGQHTSK